MEKRETREKNVSSRVETKTMKIPRKRKTNNEVSRKQTSNRRGDKQLNSTESRRTSKLDNTNKELFESKSIKENIERRVMDNKRKNTSKFEFKKENLKIIPLGGLDEIGKNITVFEYGNEIVLVDCGLEFPEDDMLGVDLVIPDVT